MDYKEKQRLARESTKPKLVDPKDYTEHDKKVAAQLTAFYSRKQRRAKPKAKPSATKKRHKGHKR
jgi:hypothetical protein